ncbi:ABC transporter ATP-binding protein [Desulfatiglans anilini]|uniref:ABC transporter ATP-binding protein n=1 Tax=Desulfatiglans anilini TaxID=90728 RepID=UPI000417490F|nr:oligopeptide/dipeptide ABC transporter ATP-binding protein [Desulfatiglans anilini]
MIRTAATETAPILKVNDLRVHFPVRRGFLQRIRGWIKAVDGVDLEVRRSRTLGLVGESGCGKSTLARAVLGLLSASGGSVVYRGRDMTGLSEKEMRPYRREFQMIFQDPYGSLNPRMTIGQSIEEGLRTVGMERRERKARVGELLEQVGLAAANEDRYPHEFSGGQRQRAGIARALSVGPSLVICDEPISALDVSIQAQIINLLNDLQESLGLAYLFISHDLNVVGYLSHDVAVMYLGQIVEYAPAEALYAAPRHPYSKALLAAVPTIEKGREGFVRPLGGDVPSPMDPPPGCRFQGRCPLVEDRCREAPVTLEAVAPDHLVRCWKAL